MNVSSCKYFVKFHYDVHLGSMGGPRGGREWGGGRRGDRFPGFWATSFPPLMISLFPAWSAPDLSLQVHCHFRAAAADDERPVFYIKTSRGGRWTLGGAV